MKNTLVKEINGQLLTQDSVIIVHEKLVHHVCKKFTPQASKLGADYEDLVNVGSMGLLKAFKYFDGVKFNVRFSTYAIPMIRGEIQRFLGSQNPGLHYPRSIKELAYKIKVAEMEELQTDVIATALEVEKDKVVHALTYLSSRQPVSVNKPLLIGSEGDDEITILHQVATEDDPTQLLVRDFLSSLTEKEQLIVKHLLDGDTQAEIGMKIGACQVSISRYQKKIRLKYQSYFNNDSPVLALA